MSFASLVSLLYMAGDEESLTFWMFWMTVPIIPWPLLAGSPIWAVTRVRDMWPSIYSWMAGPTILPPLAMLARTSGSHRLTSGWHTFSASVLLVVGLRSSYKIQGSPVSISLLTSLGQTHLSMWPPPWRLVMFWCKKGRVDFSIHSVCHAKYVFFFAAAVRHIIYFLPPLIP